MAMPTYKNSADHVTQSKLRGYYLGFNTAKIDKNVRQALASGLDRQSLKVSFKRRDSRKIMDSAWYARL